MANEALKEYEQSMSRCRELIDDIDKELITKLYDRMVVADAVGNAKFDANKPINDPVREAEVIENAVRNFPKNESYPIPTGILTDGEIRRFARTVISIAKCVEKRTMKLREYKRKHFDNHR